MPMKHLLADGKLETHAPPQRTQEAIAGIQNRRSSKSALSKAATHKAVESGEPRVDTNGDRTEITITIRRPAHSIQVAPKKAEA